MYERALGLDLVVLIFSDKGTVYSARAYKIPECSRTAAGTPLVQVIGHPYFEFLTHMHLHCLNFYCCFFLFEPDHIFVRG